jgi:nitric oxide reductase subunit C
LFFILIFVGLTVHSHRYIVNNSTLPMTEEVARGKHVWEKHACINCHTLLGEGAYFAPELGNIMTRWNVTDDRDTAFEVMRGWIDAQPSGVPGRRQMPYFEMTDQEVRDLTDFFLWVDRIDTQGWPPNDAG